MEELSVKDFVAMSQAEQKEAFTNILSDYPDWTKEEQEAYFSFLCLYGEKYVENDVSIINILDGLDYLENEEEVFYYINDSAYHVELVDYLIKYELSKVKEPNLLYHFVNEHLHVFPVSNGYIFYTE